MFENINLFLYITLITIIIFIIDKIQKNKLYNNLKEKITDSKKNTSNYYYKKNLKIVLDKDTLLNNLPSDINKKLLVTLKHNIKGTGIYAKQFIKKGNTIAYYKIKINTDTTKKPYKSPTKCVYCFTIYTKQGKEIKNVTGDIDKTSSPLPKNNIPYWAYLANEPSKTKKANAEIDINTKNNYKNRDTVNDGDYVIYKLKAKKNIYPGQEITWCYGDGYKRNYKTSC